MLERHIFIISEGVLSGYTEAHIQYLQERAILARCITSIL